MINRRLIPLITHWGIWIALGGIGGTRGAFADEPGQYLEIPQLPTNLEIGAGVSAFSKKLPSIFLSFSSSGQSYESTDARGERSMERAFRIDSSIELRVNENGISVPSFEAEIFPYETFLFDTPKNPDPEYQRDATDRLELDGTRFPAEWTFAPFATEIDRDVELSNQIRIKTYLTDLEARFSGRNQPGSFLYSEMLFAAKFLGAFVSKYRFQDETSGEMREGTKIGGDVLAGELSLSLGTYIGSAKISLDLFKLKGVAGTTSEGSYSGGIRVDVEKLGEVFAEYMSKGIILNAIGDKDRSRSVLRAGVKLDL